MMPTAFLMPAALPPETFGTLLEPSGIVTLLAAMVAAVAVGLGAALVREHLSRTRPVAALHRPSAAFAA
jgi:hypothetical protein